MAFPSLPHDLIKNLINAQLLAFFQANPRLGLISLVEIGTHVSDVDAFMPDVAVVKRTRLSGQARIPRGAPEIAIEVVSPTDTAKHLKRQVTAYLEGGASSVWVVFPEDRSVMVHTSGSVRELKDDHSISDPLLPGFSSTISAFFDLA